MSPRLDFKRRFESFREAAATLGQVHDWRVLARLVPAAARGVFLREARQNGTTLAPSRHDTHFDWRYPADYEQVGKLYSKAKAGQWDAAMDLPWSTSVDPESDDTRLLPDDFMDYERLRELGFPLELGERRRFRSAMVAWMVSQFLHGEQGALFAAAQVVSAVPFFDGKKFAATQVMDEARHVEAFSRYLDEKLGRRYAINDNLFVVVDALIRDSRWDVKFLGMQVIVEGLALSAFGNLHKRTREPLLKELLGRILVDEARHVQFGLLALRRFTLTELSPRERAEREDWAFEVALLMRDRFYAYEVYDEWFAHKMSRATWRALLEAAPGMVEFRRIMFGRLARNLRDIGLMGPSAERRWERAGLRHPLVSLARTASPLQVEQESSELQPPLKEQSHATSA